MSLPTRASLLKGMTTGKILVALTTLYILAMSLVLVWTISTIRDLQSDTLVVDLAGRQRMLQERHTREVVLRAHGRRVDYDATRAVLRETLDALIDGGSAVVTFGTTERTELAPAPSQEIREKLMEEKRLFERFVADADAFVTLVEEDPRYEQQLSQLLDLNRAFQRVVNEVVHLFDTHSQLKIARMIK